MRVPQWIMCDRRYEYRVVWSEKQHDTNRDYPVADPGEQPADPVSVRWIST